MPEIEVFLNEIKIKRLSSPAGMHWDKLRKVIFKYTKNQEGQKLLNPLILGGAIASHAAKHERL